MQIGKNDTNDMKFANLVTENYGRKYYHTGLDKSGVRTPGTTRKQQIVIQIYTLQNVFLSLIHPGQPPFRPGK